jgi:hypothetical protein
MAEEERKLETRNGPRFCPIHGVYGFINNPYTDCEICRQQITVIEYAENEVFAKED